MTQPLPSHRQAIILRCIAGERVYGVQIGELYERRAGHIAKGALYETLAVLEMLGWAKCAIGEDTHARGGNRRKYYTIRRAGRKALARFVKTVQ